MTDNLKETISEKYDNEINMYELITFESIMMNSKLLNNYRNNVVNNYITISMSIKKIKNNINLILY